LIIKQLIKVHDWMGQLNLSAFETFIKMIRNKFQNVNYKFPNDDLIELFTTIARRISDNALDLK
jgi:hypothetical protein